MSKSTISQKIDPFVAENRQAMLAAIIDSSEDAIISKTLDGYITSWNKSAERIFGYKAAEVIGKNIRILIPATRLDEENMILSEIISGQRVEHFETVRVTKSGAEIPISLTVSPIKGNKGNIIGASKIARDISKQKAAEKATETYMQNLEHMIATCKAISEKMDIQVILQKVTDISTNAIGAQFGAFFYNTIDPGGESYLLYTLSGAPKEAFEKFGMPRNTDVFRKTFTGEGILRSDDIRKDPRYGHNAPNHGMPNGHLPVVSYFAIPVISQTGEVLGGLFFGHPEKAVFTEEHERIMESIVAYAAIALDNAKLFNEVQLLNARKDEFIGIAGHELRTPLTTIKGYLQLSAGNKDMRQVEQFMGKALKQVNKLQVLISDLLDVSKIEARLFEYNFRPCSLQQLIRDGIDAIRQTYPSRKIEYHSHPDDTMVTADALKIGQVLTNFLSNAVKYSPAPLKIIVRVKEEKHQVIVSVQDFGIGISSEDIANIFKRYYRVPDARNITGGLGVGLYIAKEIIDKHNGAVWVESAHGRGSTFYFSLPLQTDPQPA